MKHISSCGRQIIDVFRLKDDVPLTYIIYKELAPTSDMPMDALRRQIRLEQDDVTSRISDLERCTLLRLLEKNTKRLDPKYHEIASTKEMKRLGFRPSFLLPLCPINMRNLGSLAKDSGCEVCGKKNTSRCVQCMSVVYCSKGVYFYALMCEQNLNASCQNVRDPIGRLTNWPANLSKEVHGTLSQCPTPLLVCLICHTCPY